MIPKTRLSEEIKSIFHHENPRSELYERAKMLSVPGIHIHPKLLAECEDWGIFEIEDGQITRYGKEDLLKSLEVSKNPENLGVFLDYKVSSISWYPEHERDYICQLVDLDLEIGEFLEDKPALTCFLKRFSSDADLTVYSGHDMVFGQLHPNKLIFGPTKAINHKDVPLETIEGMLDPNFFLVLYMNTSNDPTSFYVEREGVGEMSLHTYPRDYPL